MTGFRKPATLAMVGLVLALTGCQSILTGLPQSGKPSAAASGTPALATPTEELASATTAAPTWGDSPLIDPLHDMIFSNVSGADRRTDIYGSSTVLDTDTRWVIDAQVQKQRPNGEEYSTGIVLKGFDAQWKVQSFSLVYDSGMWAIGFTHGNSDNQIAYWRDFESLTSPSQHFVLSISGNGQRLSLENDQGFAFTWAMPDRLFVSSRFISLQTEVGPHTRISVHRLSIQQLRTPRVADNTPHDQVAGWPPLSVLTPGGQVGYVFHVAPNGSDHNPGTADLPFASLEHARDVVRTIGASMRGPAIVYLHGGVYPVDHTIQFGPQDSGQNGYDIIYRAAPGETPALSGGISVGGWQNLPNSQIWRAKLGDVKDFRQLYVNGVRARRAASEQPVTGVGWAGGGTSARDGIVMGKGQLPAISRPQDLELHWIEDWRDMRLPVSSIQANPDGTHTIWMRQPYFSYALSMAPANPAAQGWYPRYDIAFYLENAVELLDQPGEWYYNLDSHDLYYRPRPGEDLNSAQVVIPQTEQLLDIAGRQAGDEVHNLTFDGLTFEYAGWTRANDVGTFGWQAQALLDKPAEVPNFLVMTPAQVQLSYAHDVHLVRSRFEHLGAVAVSLGQDAFDDTVQGNLFRDISDGAVVVGHWDDAYITAPSIQVAPHDDLIADNLIQDVGVEYWGAPAVTAYYVANINIVHNEIADVAYTGVSLGWGWSFTRDSTTSHGNQVKENLITFVNLRANDGGGIYTLGQQPNTVVAGNVIRNVLHDFACLYPDEGSAYISFRDNVCDGAPQWLHLWIASIHDVQVNNTFTNVPLLVNAGTNIDLQNTTAVSGQSWPTGAQAIIDQAGLEPDYAYLRTWLKSN